MATYSTVLAWRIPGTVEPGGLPSMRSQSRTRPKRLSSSNMVVLSLVFKEISILSFIVAVSIYIPTISVGEFPFLHHLFFVEFLFIAILSGLKRYLIVGLIYISLTMSDIEHLFICLLAICMSSLEKCLLRSLLNSLLSSLSYDQTIPLLDIYTVKIIIGKDICTPVF